MSHDAETSPASGPARIVLAGAGYAHLLLLRRQCSQPMEGSSLTLVSPITRAPYTGMLPGHIAGEYSAEEIHIDLEKICARAGVNLVIDSVCGVDREAKQILLESGNSLGYDLLSLNTGPMPDIRIPGAQQHGISLKPVTRFLPKWQEVFETLCTATQPRHVVMAGGGPGSVETLIAMRLALRQAGTISHRLTLLTASERLLPAYPAGVARSAARRCQALDIDIRTRFRIDSIGATCLQAGDISLDFDHLFLCLDAAAPSWPRDSGFDCDGKGFIAVDASLQSRNTPGVFASGDVAAFEPALPKAGVFSVREAPILATNLKRCLASTALRDYRPQQRFLSLLSLGDGRAAGSYGNFGFSGHWVWWWKRYIDRRFMKSFRNG